MGRARSGAQRTRCVAATLIALALLFRFMVPPGYMIDAKAPTSGLVICTGHGPLQLGGHEGPRGPSHKSPDAPCAFAGAVTPITPPLAVDVAPPQANRVDPHVASPLLDLAPGRGLAAPPPPSRGPPQVSI